MKTFNAVFTARKFPVKFTKHLACFTVAYSPQLGIDLWCARKTESVCKTNIAFTRFLASGRKTRTQDRKSGS
jgi:hypothetical protein